MTTSREKLATVPDPKGVLSLVTDLVGHEVVRRGGLSLRLDGAILTILSSDWWLHNYGNVQLVAEALLGADKRIEDIDLDAILDRAWALIEKAPEVKYPRSDRRLSLWALNPGRPELFVEWMIPIPPGERDTNMIGVR